MTVGELVESLKSFPQDLELVVDGYEGGVGPSGKPKLVEVWENSYGPDYYGPHKVVKSWNRDNEDNKDIPIVQKVYLSRDPNEE